MMSEVNRRERRRSFFLLSAGSQRKKWARLPSPAVASSIPPRAARTMLEKLSSRDSQSGLSSHSVTLLPQH